jgi:hypothetical protein
VGRLPAVGSGLAGSHSLLLTGGLIDGLVGGLIDGLVGGLIDGLVGGLIGGLVGLSAAGTEGRRVGGIQSGGNPLGQRCVGGLGVLKAVLPPPRSTPRVSPCANGQL